MIQEVPPTVRKAASFVELLRARAADRPLAPLYTFLAGGEEEAGTAGAAELDLRARALAAVLQESGAAGERALLLFPPGLDFITAFFGCLYAGAVAVPAYPPRAERIDPRLEEIVRDCRPRVVLTTAAILGRLRSRGADSELGGLQGARWIAIDETGEGRADDWREPELGPGSLAFLQYTSGSTSAPKGVRVTHGNLLHNEGLIRRAFRQTEASVVVGWLPLYHDMGLIGNVLQPLYSGGRAVLMSPWAFLQSPARWLRAISRYRATTSGGPDFAYDLCARRVRPEQRAELDLSSWEVAFNGAEPVRAETLERFAAAFAPCGFRREAFQPCYGLAEATLLVAAGSGGGPVLLPVDAGKLERGTAVRSSSREARWLVGCGQPGETVRIVDPETGIPRGDGSVGEIWVAGPSVAAGYWQRPAASGETFGARLAGEDGPPFLRTGDLGLVAGGELYVTGRLKDLIIVRGRNLYPQDIERTAEGAHPALRPGSGAAFSVEVDGEERLVAAVEVERRTREEEIPRAASAVRSAVVAEHEVQVHEVVLLAAGTLPRTSSGKVRRGACRAAYLGGGLEVVGRSVPAAAGPEVEADLPNLRGLLPALAPAERRPAVEAFLRQVLGPHPPGPPLPPPLAPSPGEGGGLIGLSLDSLAAAALAYRIESATGVSLSPVDLLRGPSFEELVAEVLARLAEGAGEEDREEMEGEPVASFGQRALWFLDRLDPGSSAYVLAGAVRLEGRLDLPALSRSLGEVVRRHEVLRTTFEEVDGEPVPRVHPFQEWTLPVADLAGLPEEGRGEESRRLSREEGRRGFDLERGPLFRAVLVRLGSEEHRLLAAFHHIVADGPSMGVISRELEALYGAFCRDLPSPLGEWALQSLDVSRRERRRLAGGVLERQLAWWRGRLAGWAPLELPTDRPRRMNRSWRPRGGRLGILVEAGTVGALRSLTEQRGATLFMGLLASFQALLGRHADQEDLAVGVPAAQRRGAEGLVGYFINTVVLRADLAGSPSFRGFLDRTRSAALEAWAHPDVPFETLVAELAPGRDPRTPPLVQTFFTLQAEPLRLRLPGLETAVAELDTGEAKLDLALSLVEEGDGLAGTLEYDADLFDAASMQRLAAHFTNLLRAAVAAPETPVPRLDLLSAAERHQVRVEWAGGPSPAGLAATVLDLFAARAAEAPEATALVAAEREVTFRELRRRAGLLARRLAALGVEPGAVVGLQTERTPDLIAGLLGILEAGGVLLPLDPSHPAERITCLIEDSGAVALVRDGGEGDLACLPLSRRGASSGRRPAPGDLAYLIYTSGTTGRPKPVAVEHGSLLHTLRSAMDLFGFGPGERMPVVAPASFDIFLFELLAPLLSGGTPVLLPLRPTLDIDLVVRELERSTRFHAVPAVLRQVVDRVLTLGEPQRFAGLREVYTGGDVVPADLLADLQRAFPHARVQVLYGPTEGTILATSHSVPPAGRPRPLLGRPLPGVTVRLLDAAGEPVPAGVAGEIVLGGAGVARGYPGRPGVTAERFVPDADRYGGRAYRTGDLARWLADGRLEFLGRADAQVKVRGVRIEPGEIEARLASHPAVRQAAVVARGGAGERSLAAWVVPEEGNAPDEAELRDFLRAGLPEAMVPGAVVLTPELPLTPHGKVDRRALAERPLPAAPDEARRLRRPPGDPVEELVASLWAGVLGSEEVGIDDDFFALGGHSLLATQVVSRLRDAFGVELPLRVLFDEPTVAGVAARVRAAVSEVSAPPLVPLPRPDRSAGGLPLSFAQQRLWFLQQLAPESAFYNMPAALRLTGPLHEPALERSFEEIVHRHEALRTRFPLRGDRPEQVIDPPARRPLPVVDLLHLPLALRQAEADRLALLEARHPFDLARGPLLRTVLLRLEPERHLLLVDMHHVISDGWSVAVLYQDFAALYEAGASGRPSPLPPLPVQYADFTLWQRAWLQGEVLEAELAHWRRRLADLPPPDLPADRPRPAVQSFRGETLRFAIPRGLTEELRRLSHRLGVTLFMTLLAGFKAVIQRYTGREDMALGSPIANRDRAEIERLVGFFVNTLVLRTDLSGDPGFRELAARVREVCLDAYAHQALPFERLVEELEPERDLARQPLFGTMFQLLEMPPERLAIGPLTLERLETETGTAAFDLALDLVDGPEGILVKAVYSADLFDAVTIRRLLEHYTALLAAVAGGDERPLVEIELLSPAERHQLVTEWSLPPEKEELLEGEQGGLLHEDFLAWAEIAPDAVAVTMGEQSLTYGELARRALGLARHLRSLGAGPEVTVAVCLERSPEMVTALLGTLASGGVYLPLDPAFPQGRLAFLLEDSGAALAVTTSSTARRLPSSGARLVLLEEETWEGTGTPLPPTDPADLAYVIYTSGSTGRPKGVGVSHDAATAHCRAIARVDRLGPDDCVLQFASASFDVSFEEILPTLGSGARLLLRPPQGWSPAELLQSLADFDLSVVGLPTAFWSQFAEEAERGTPPQAGHRVRLVIVGGEAMPAEALRRWHAGPLAGIPLLNAYGPTETLVTAAVADLTRLADPATGRVPIGRPLAGRVLHVVDPRGAPVPVGVAGELWIGGPLLARGYLGRPELTAERFIPDALSSDGGRLYRTGDLVRRLADGSVEYLGRTDQQVKIRGFRIELGEIEAALAAHPAVRQVAVAVREEAPGDRRLAAYVVCDPDGAGLPLEEQEARQVEEWQAVYDKDVYGRLPDPTFNVLGWDSSYTREPIPEEEMRQWLDGTIGRLLGRLRPAGNRVLEIGCGTGLVLFRVAPRCDRYLGTDFSAAALGYVRDVLASLPVPIPGVELRQGAADDPATLGPEGGERFDAVILNSVVQYFPSADYLVRVLEEAVARTAPGGFVFIGDVRSLPLLDAFHAAVELYRAADDLPRERLARRVAAAVAADPELVLAPAFFSVLAQRLPRVSHVEIELRRGYRWNELTRFRYDVVLHVERPEESDQPVWLDWQTEGLSLPALRQRLDQEETGLLGLRRVPNARVAAELETVELLRDPAGPWTAGELRREIGRHDGVDPEEVWALAGEVPYDVAVTWSDDPACFDVVLRHRGGRAAPMPGLAPLVSPEVTGPWRRWASDPLRRKAERLLVPRLIELARERLPVYMVPADVVVLDALPLTAQGKLDYRALPAPERVRPELEEGFVAPRTPEERELAALWADLLGLERVGIRDNFFNLGGHSLLATQAVSRVRQAFGVDLPLRALFEEPTVAGLAARVRAALEAGERPELPPVEPVARRPGEPLPLSFGQQRLWLLGRMETAYHMAGAFRLDGDLRPAALEAALGEVVRRHEVLRTVYREVNGGPVQVIQSPSPVSLPLVDLASLPQDARQEESRRLGHEEARRPFDLTRDLMLRGLFVRLSGREHLALVTLHHIASDGWSIAILGREVGALYGAMVQRLPSPLPELEIQYADFAVWQRRWLEGRVLDAQLAWWREHLAAAPALLELPGDRPRPAVRTSRAGRRAFACSSHLDRRLRELAAGEGTTPFAVLLAAFFALLGRLTGRQDLLVGTPVAGRRQAETEGLIGFFVNTLVMRASAGGDPSFRQLIGRVHRAALGALAHQDLPFERLVEELQPPRDLSYTPLFQVMFSLQNQPVAALDLPGVTLTQQPLEPESRFDLELTLFEEPEGLAGTLDFSVDLFDAATAEQWAEAYLRLLEEGTAHPATRLSELPLLSETERRQILEWGQGPAVAADGSFTVLDLFAAQVERTPDAPALVWNGEVISYLELSRRVDGVARRLEEEGVGPGMVAGLRIERSAEMVAGLLGIMKAGAVFLPLDPAYPEERLDWMVEDSGAVMVVGPGGEDSRLVGRTWETPSQDLAYLIYTSGTTGLPKAVAVEHGNLLHTLRSVTGLFGFGPGDRMPAIAPFSFDIFLFETLAPLLSGGTSVLLPLRPTLDLDLLLAEIAASTRLHAVPAVLRQVVDRIVALGLAGRFSLAEIYVGGDAVPPALLADAAAAFPGVPVRILYGPTEATILATSWPVPPGQAVPGAVLGHPLPGVQVDLLDAAGLPVPVGVTGEVVLSGPGITRGYLGRPDLTADRYRPASGGQRAYHTGDLARWRPGGLLEFLGRADSQVKVRGFRVEPGEIEARLAAHPGVRQAAVTVIEAGGERHLAGFFVPQGADGAGEAELRDHLRRALPEHMVPAVLVPLDAIPLTPNAKVDRDALATFAAMARPTTAEPPSTPTQEILAGVWTEILGIPSPGIHDDFFALGGHSLLATRLASRVRELFGVELPLRAVFESPTIAGLARHLDTADTRALPPIQPRDPSEPLPLSFAQQRLWFLDQMHPGDSSYNLPVVLELDGPLDPATLESALTGIVQRHESLRTTFPSRAGEPYQLIHDATPFNLPLIDLTALPTPHREALQLALAEIARPFDLTRGPLLRGLLLRTAERGGPVRPAQATGRAGGVDGGAHPKEPSRVGADPLAAGHHHLLILTMHHIVSDAWSMDVLARELGLLYTATPLPPLPIQYADFALWQRRYLSAEPLAHELAWWRHRLAGAPPLLDLPTDHPRPAVRTQRGDELSFHLPAHLAHPLESLGHHEGATLFMTLLAAFQVLLARLANQQDVSVGTPIAGRRQAETEPLIGFFVNTLVMRTDLAGEPGFRTILGRVRDMALGAYAHQDLPFERLVEEIAPERNLAHTPLFQAVFTLQRQPAGLGSLPGLTVAPLRLGARTAKFDLTLTLSEEPGGLAGWLEYSADLFDRTTVQRWAGHFQALLESAAADSDQPWTALPLLDDAQRHQVTVEWGADFQSDFPRSPLAALFAEQVERTPEALAVVFGDERLTYRELDRQAEALAERLRHAGVGPETLVGISLERSAALVVGMLGILKAGGAYVPLDPEYPRERIDFMVGDAGVAVVVAPHPQPLSHPLPSDRERGPGGEGLPGEALAYVTYTSGSTGVPKGIAIPQSAVARLVLGTNYIDLGPGDRVGQVSNATFDAATFEVWGALLTGATLVGIPREVILSPGRFARTLAETGVSAMFLTTALFNQVAREVPDAFASVRRLLVGGEAMDPRWAAEVLEKGAPGRLVNAYGPTEGTTFSTWHPIDTIPPGRSVPIGRALANARTYVVDRELRPVPPGVAGELCLGGEGLARGYLRRPGLTAAAFVPDPLSGLAGERLYRTGDLVRWAPEGTIEFFGRLDHQVKLRGFRIELGEIETALAALPEVREAAVLVREVGPGDRRLVAYVVPREAPDSAAVRSALQSRLPDYMIPSALVWLEALPLNANGKVDRRALLDAELATEPAGEVRAAPRDLVEEQLAAIWEELLGVPRVGIHDDFFELGGHSLLATRVVSRVREAFGIELPLRTLFAAPTVARLAVEVEEERRRGAGLASPPVTPVPRDGDLPLSFSQEWMWIADQLEAEGGGYNAPMAVRLRGRLSIPALAAALGEVVRRHEALRTTFHSGESGPVQRVHREMPVPLWEIDLGALRDDTGEVERVAAALSRWPFDLVAGPPLRTCLVRLGDADHVLLLTLHHLVTDGWSGGILLEDLAVLYRAAGEGRPSPLPALPVQYADFAVWQRRWLAGEVMERLVGYWRERLAGRPGALEVPTDRPRSAVRTQWGARLPVAFPREVSDGFEALARAERVTPFTVLLALWKILLARYSHQEDLVVGTPVANRSRRELEGVVGYFVNDLPLRTDLSGEPSFRALLARVHETALGAQAHQDLPAVKLAQEMGGPAGALFQAWFQLQNTPPLRIDLPDLAFAEHRADLPAATFELELALRETEGGLEGYFSYNRDLFRRETAEAMLGHLLALAEGAAVEPDRPIWELPLLSEAEWQQVAAAGRVERCGGELPLHRQFEAWAAEAPDRVAVTSGEESLTYGELNRRAGGLAQRLRGMGIGPESRVGVSLPRSAELLVAILGVLKAGGAYVPLDPAYPRERLEMLVEESRVAVVVDDPHPSSPSPILSQPPGEGETSHPDHLAYVIYTSGSTGRPKGVMVTHRQVARLFEASGWFGFGAEDVWTLFHSYAFDFSVWEIWGALLHGGRLVVVPYETSRSPEEFRELLVREGVTVLNQTPSAFQGLIRRESTSLGPQGEALRWVIFGGEALDLRALAPWFQRHGDVQPRLVNMFGITETTVHVTLRPLTCADTEEGTGSTGSVIGEPLPDLRLYLLDRRLCPVPPGVVGEVFVGGGGVARGYLHRPDLTAERFVPDPFADLHGEAGARLYRSGDLARRRRDGELEYLGRADQQLKIRGFRIEPGEIEAALLRQPDIREAVVLARDYSEGDRRLVAYLATDAALDLAALRAALLETLPEHMVPAAFVPLPALPLTAHGKVDRRALAALEPEARSAPTAAAEPPAGPLEEILSALWTDLLGVEAVGRDESFFALGGHSLLMTQVASRLKQLTGVTLPMRSFFEQPTVHGLAGALLTEMVKATPVDRLERMLAEVEGVEEEEVGERIGEKRESYARVLTPRPPLPSPTLPPPGEGETSIRDEGTLSPPLPGSGWAGDGRGGRGVRTRGQDAAPSSVLSVRDLLARLPEAPPAVAPPPITAMGFPTANRPEVLERGIISYAEATRDRGQALRFVVTDDSRTSAMREEYRRRLADLSRRLGVDIRYAGLEQKERFAAALAGTSGLPLDTVRLALFDTRGVGLSAGANRNALLLATAGEMVLSVDDDTTCRVALSPAAPAAPAVPAALDSGAGIALRSGTDPGTAFLSGRDPGEIRAFAGREEALGSLDLRPADLPAIHEAMLGRDVRTWLAGLDPDAPAELETADPAFVRTIERGGRVLVTTNGWAGDCGWHSPTFYMLLTGESRRRLVRSPEAYRVATASKEIVRSVPRPTVGNGDSFMATLFTGLDNRGLLPPFPAVLWGEDLLFGILLSLCFGEARVGHLPWVAAHEPMEVRRFWPGEMQRSASGIDHSRLVSALLDGFTSDPGADPAASLRALGDYLTALGLLDPADFDERGRRAVLARAGAFAEELERRLAAWRHEPESATPGGALWAEDVRGYLHRLRQHAARPDFAVPLDLLYGREPEEARRLAQHLLLDYGRLLTVWPDLVAAARELRARGIEMAEAVR